MTKDDLKKLAAEFIATLEDQEHWIEYNATEQEEAQYTLDRFIQWYGFRPAVEPPADPKGRTVAELTNFNTPELTKIREDFRRGLATAIEADMNGQAEPPADRKSALDEIVRISEEAGLYDDPAVERELMQRSLELLRAFRHAYEPGTQFPLIGELESFIEKGRRERYISAARNRLMQLGRSEDVATEGAKSLWRTASTETGALTPEKDADEYDVGYEAGRDTL